MKLMDNVIIRMPDEYKRILHRRGPQAGQYHLDGRQLTTDGDTVEYSDDDTYDENRLFNAPSFVTDGTLCAICIISEVLYLFYVDEDQIKYRTSDDNSVTWSSATTTIAVAQANSLDALVVDGEIYVFFADKDAGCSGIYYITSADNYAGRHNVTSSSDDRYHIAAIAADNPSFYSEGTLSGNEIVMLTFTHNDLIYLIMSDEGMDNWEVIEPIGIASGQYSNIGIGDEGYPVITFTWNGRLYITTGLVTSQWTCPLFIGQCTRFVSMIRSEGVVNRPVGSPAYASGNEKIDVMLNDDKMECLRYGHSLTVMLAPPQSVRRRASSVGGLQKNVNHKSSARHQPSVLSYDVPGYVNGAYLGGQEGHESLYGIVYSVDGKIKVALSNTDEAMSVDRKYNPIGEGYLHIWYKPGDVVALEITLEHNHQVAVGDSISIIVRAINQIGSGKHDALVSCSVPANGTITPNETMTDRYGYARFTYTKTSSPPETLTFTCEGVSKAVDIIS